MSIGLRKGPRAHAHALPRAPSRAHVGAAADVAPTTPAAFVPIFAGWNVWDIWQADDPSFSVMTLGESLERQLRVWVENAVKDGAPGAAVADPLNPAALRGAQVQPIGRVTDLKVAERVRTFPSSPMRR